MQDPYKIWSINIDNMIYKNQKETKDKKIIFIKYEDDTHLKNMVFQLPTLNNNINLSDNEIEISINNDEEKENKIIDFLNLIDTKVIKDAKINATSWFSHVKDKSKINYHHILRSVNNDSYYTLKLKIIDSKDFKTNLILPSMPLR